MIYIKFNMSVLGARDFNSVKDAIIMFKCDILYLNISQYLMTISGARG